MRWIIGDIHGMLAPLQTLLRAIEIADHEAELIFIGDYVNRGSESREVIDLLLTLREARFIRGNHDDIFDLVLSGHSFASHPNAPNPLSAACWFMEHGLDKTLMSYSADPAELETLVRKPSYDRLMAIVAQVPVAHREFFRRLAPIIDEHDFFVAHASWDGDEPTADPGVAARLQAEPDLGYGVLWGRFTEEQLHRRKRWSKPGIFGHTPVVNYLAAAKAGNIPIVGPQTILIDTGLALGPTGRLTAYCFDSQTFIQTDRRGAVVEDDEGHG